MEMRERGGRERERESKRKQERVSPFSFRFMHFSPSAPLGWRLLTWSTLLPDYIPALKEFTGDFSRRKLLDVLEERDRVIFLFRVKIHSTFRGGLITPINGERRESRESRERNQFGGWEWAWIMRRKHVKDWGLVMNQIFGRGRKILRQRRGCWNVWMNGEWNEMKPEDVITFTFWK